MSSPVVSVRAARLDQLASETGQFAILALDHLRSFAVTVRPEAPDSMSSLEMGQLKEALIDGLAHSSTAVLIDPVLATNRLASGAAQLPVGLILGIEDGDYEAAAVAPRLLPGWTVERAANLGADAVKISFYFEADSDTSVAERFVEETVRQCDIYEMPLFCEPLVRLQGSGDARYKVLDGVKRFGSMGADVLKIQFPCDTDSQTSRDEWVDACEAVSALSQSPWALLSEGRDYQQFRELLAVACAAGASGFLGGRAIWGGAGTDGAMSTYAQRLLELRTIAVRQGTPWQNHRPTTN